MASESTPTVSVIIPCYRQARLLPQAIESVLAQTYRPIEIVVVNDGSDDDTEVVARRYQSQTTYVWQPNGGISSARNAGIAAARGQYLVFLDADDLLHSEAIARLTDAVRAKPNSIGLMGVRYFADDPAIETAPQDIPPPIDRLLPWLFRENLAIHAFLCPRSAVIRAGQFKAPLRKAEDWDLWLRMGLSDIPVAAIPWCGAYYRRYPGSSSTDRSGMARGKANMFLAAWPILRDRSEFRSDWAPAFLRSLYAVRRQCRLLKLDEDEKRLDDAIVEIRKQGIRVEPQSPLAVRIQDRLPRRLGDLFESTMLRLCRLLRPRLYDSLSR